MVTNPTQDNRVGQLKTPLGKDKLLLSSFSVAEELSKPFEIRIECVSTEKNIDFNQAIGKNCGILLNCLGKKQRHFSGVLVEASWFGERDGFFAYHLVLRPWLWLLTQASDCRIFQNKSAPDIIKDVFSKLGFNDVEFNVGSYKPIEYCVQYRETHFDFVSRLMEKYGMYYYFKHEENKHILAIADRISSHQPIPELPNVKFASMGERARDTEQYLTTWRIERRFRTGKVSLNAYDFGNPTANMHTEKTAAGGYARDQLEVYLYPEKYKKGEEQSVAKQYAEARLHATQAMDQRRYATGNAPSLFSGGRVTLQKIKEESENREYLVLAATHTFVAEQYSSGDGGGGRGNSYNGSYVLLPSDRPFKAPVATPRPLITGPQTAVVVGQRGEEVHTDKYGRIKIQFHWDRDGKKDENSSRWVRVAQSWSSKSWGGMIIPRMGMEVVVEFLEGDPDRPLVVGAVYNADNMPPYELPANKTQSGFKTRSSKSGNDSHYNELLFEDKKGHEFICVHGEKDLNITVEDAETLIVKGKNKKPIGGKTRNIVVEQGDDIKDISTGDSKLNVGNNQFIDVAENQKTSVGKNVIVEAGDSITLKVGGSKIVMKKGSITIDTGDLTISTSKKTVINGGMQIIQKAGLIKLN